MRLIQKFQNSIRKDGFLKAIRAVATYPGRYWKFKSFKSKMLEFDSDEERWTYAWQSNSWRKDESASGDGSSLQYTQNLRRNLPILFKKFGIKTVFDAPCGDLNWMSSVLSLYPIKYQGGDIVKPLVDELNDKFGSNNASFIYFNLIDMVPPKSDLMICRDCLIHFSHSDTHSMLNNFLLSGTKYLLTTTHTNRNGKFDNRDILNGEFRMIDLFSAPYNFSSTPLFVIDDWIPPFPERQMCLWNREQIQSAISKMSDRL